MAQESPRRKKRFPFLRKTNSEAHPSSDPPPPGQSHRGPFALLGSKAKDLFARRAERSNPSQRNSPSAGASQQDPPQLTVPEEGADELPITTSDYPNMSLKESPSDGNRDVSTPDQHAQQQSSKLPETERFAHESQTAHGAESNDPTRTGVTSKPRSEEVDAARQSAREAVSELKPVFGPVQAVASGINDVNDAGDAVAAVDNIASLLTKISKHILQSLYPRIKHTAEVEISLFYTGHPTWAHQCIFVLNTGGPVSSVYLIQTGGP